jgi:DNA-binding response OmpR family regulator
MKLLWVENHAVFVRQAGRFLAAHQVTVVPSIASAKDALLAAPFDAILLDQDLDDGKGSSLVEFIRDLPCSPPVIAVSAHPDGNSALLAAGAVAACPKIRFAQIETVLRSVVAGYA